MRRAGGWAVVLHGREHRSTSNNGWDEEDALAEATVKVVTNGTRHIESAEGHGPVGALDNALRKALTNEYPALDDMNLEDYRVRVLDETVGTGATVRVLIDTSNGEREWTTVGVSENIIEASWEALVDGYTYGLLHPGGRRRGSAGVVFQTTSDDAEPSPRCTWRPGAGPTAATCLPSSWTGSSTTGSASGTVARPAGPGVGRPRGGAAASALPG
jgi:hypothetical protein